MKKHLFNLVAVSILLMTVLSACKKDPKGDGGGGGESSSVIDAKNIIGDATDGVDHVKVFVDCYTENHWNKYEVGAGTFINDGFTIHLRTLSSEYLGLVYDLVDDNLVVSDKDAKMSDITEIFAYSNEGKIVGEFRLYGQNDNIGYKAAHIYADRNFTIKGTELDNGYTFAYDCDFRKGWNVVYFYYGGPVEQITTQRPPDANFQWHYQDQSGWDGSPKPAKQSKLFSRLGKTSY